MLGKLLDSNKQKYSCERINLIRANVYYFYILKIAALLVLAVAAQARLVPFYGPFYGYTGYFGNFVPVFTSNQYHAQDELGQASFGYSHPGQAASNYRDAFGNQIGSYAYINPEGKHVQVSYVADSNGFRVLSNDLPVAPVDTNIPVVETEEVAEARAAHLVAVEDAKNGVLPLDMPQEVEDTEEVAAAKAQHAVAVAAAKSTTDGVEESSIATASDDQPLTYTAPVLSYTTPDDVPIMTYTAPDASADDSSQENSLSSEREKREINFFEQVDYDF